MLNITVTDYLKNHATLQRLERGADSADLVLEFRNLFRNLFRNRFRNSADFHTLRVRELSQEKQAYPRQSQKQPSGNRWPEVAILVFIALLTLVFNVLLLLVFVAITL